MPTSPILPWAPQQFLNQDGTPLAGGLVYTRITSTTTPLATYSSADLDPLSVRTNPIVLGDDGTPEDGEAIYFLPQAYRILVHDSDDVLLYERDPVLDPGYQFATYIGQLQTAGGTTEHTSPYTVLETDRLVRLDSSGGAVTVNLPAAADYTALLVLKNMGTNTCAITPNGADTIEGIAAAYTLAAAASPAFPTLVLMSDGVDAWWIFASHEA